MLKKQLSRLGFLMDRFSITGRELANALHVDYSLVSKWRSNSRVLTPRSVHLKKIVEFFVALDSNTQYSTFVEILSEVYPNAQLKSSKEISSFLTKWLSESNDTNESNDLLVNILNNKDANKGQYYIFKGNTGRREAVIKFLDIALSAPEGQELLLFTQENPSWFCEDEEFLNVWREKNLEILHKDGKIRIIHTVDRLYKSIAFSLIRWLPMHLNSNTVPYYYPHFLDTPIKVTLFVVKDRAAIFGITSEGLTKTTYTYLCFDPITLMQCQFAIQSLLAGSLPLFEKFFPNNTEKLMRLLIKTAQKEENEYCISLPPYFAAMSQELLRSILVENKFNEDSILSYMGYQYTMKEQFYANSSKCYIRCIYDISWLEQLLTSDEIYLNELSILMGSRIKVSRDIFCQCIQEIITLLEKIPNFEIALLEGPPAAGLDSIFMRTKENTITISSTMSQDRKLPFSLVVQEMTAVNSYFHYFNQIWSEIPQIKRDKKWVKQKFSHAILKFKV